MRTRYLSMHLSHRQGQWKTRRVAGVSLVGDSTTIARCTAMASNLHRRGSPRDARYLHARPDWVHHGVLCVQVCNGCQHPWTAAPSRYSAAVQQASSRYDAVLVGPARMPVNCPCSLVHAGIHRPGRLQSWSDSVANTMLTSALCLQAVKRCPGPGLSVTTWLPGHALYSWPVVCCQASLWNAAVELAGCPAMARRPRRALPRRAYQDETTASTSNAGVV